MAPPKQQQSMFIDNHTTSQSTPTKQHTTKKHNTIKSPQPTSKNSSNIMNFFKKPPLSSTTINNNNNNSNQIVTDYSDNDVISINSSSEDDVIMIDSSSVHPPHQQPIITSTTNKQLDNHHKKKRKYESSSSSGSEDHDDNFQDHKKENIDPKSLHNQNVTANTNTSTSSTITSPKKKKLKEQSSQQYSSSSLSNLIIDSSSSIIPTLTPSLVVISSAPTTTATSTTPNVAITNVTSISNTIPTVATAAAAATTVVDKTTTPTTVEECEELIQQLVEEVKTLKPSMDDSKKLRKDERIRKYLKKMFEFCQTNKEFQSNKNTYPFKPAFINLLIAYCQGVTCLDLDELIQDVRSCWRRIAVKKQYITTTTTTSAAADVDSTIDNLLPTIEAMKNAINLHLERKVYGVKDLCEISVWEARKLSSLTTKIGSTARDCATLAKQMRSNFKKIAEVKGREINKLQKLKVKLEKQAAKETKKEEKQAKKEAKKEAAAAAVSTALNSASSSSAATNLTSPSKNKNRTTVKCKSITLFTQKCNILLEDKVVSAPVCRVQSDKTIEEMDLAIASQNYPISMKETISSILNNKKKKENPIKKSKIAFKFISLGGKGHIFKKDDEDCQSTIVNGRKPFAKDPNMIYPEEDEEEMEDLVLGEADLAVEGECLDSEDDDMGEVEFDEESDDDSNSMTEDGDSNICADDIIEYEDGKIEHVETGATVDSKKKKKKQQLSELDPIFECTNQLQQVSFVVDEDFILDIAELNCNQVFWWQHQPSAGITSKKNEQSSAVESSVDKMDTSTDQGVTAATMDTDGKKKKKKKQVAAVSASAVASTTTGMGELVFVNQTTTTTDSSSPSFTSPSKAGDVWDKVQMEHLKSILNTCGTKPEIVTAMLQQFPSLSKNRVNKKIKEIIVKEKRDGDSKTKFYMKE